VPISIARRADQSRSIDLFDCREPSARAPSSRHLVSIRSGSAAATLRLVMTSGTNSIEDRNPLFPWQLRLRDVSRGGLPRPPMTYATELANTNISVYTLMKLLGHESIATSQRYVIGARVGDESRTGAEPSLRPC
jgi:hypothetical protein